MYDLESIIDDIKNERCILIVGPDLINFNGKTLFEVFCEDIENNCNDKLRTQHVFVAEELLLLASDIKPTPFGKLMEKFYKKQDCYNSPFTKISQIPFHLIISLFPDDRLCKIFENQKYDYQFNHYPLENNPTTVEKPSKSRPLIYNLLGNLNDVEFIITFDHLFTFLSGIMGDRKLPGTLLETLMKATTCIFLGVRFDRWYMQLLLKIITPTKKAYNPAFLNSAYKNDTGVFIAQRLDLEYADVEPLDFLDTLYNECKKQQLLKDGGKTKIFISYSHNDKDVVLKIKDQLTIPGIEVIIDEQSMQGGQKIDEFIKIIKGVKCVVAIISKNSMLSPWVLKEVSLTLTETDKLFIPCYLDKTFMDIDFLSKTADCFVKAELKKIDELIAQRGTSKTDDLFAKRAEWENYWHALPGVMSELQKTKCISLEGNDYDSGIQKIITMIENL
jgi:hypothetical protein